MKREDLNQLADINPDAQEASAEELFLENLASVHTIAAGMLESALKNLKLEVDADITVLSRLEKSANAMRKIEAMIVKRKCAGGRRRDDSEAA